MTVLHAKELQILEWAERAEDPKRTWNAQIVIHEGERMEPGLLLKNAMVQRLWDEGYLSFLKSSRIDHEGVTVWLFFQLTQQGKEALEEHRLGDWLRQCK